MEAEQRDDESCRSMPGFIVIPLAAIAFLVVLSLVLFVIAEVTGPPDR
jgi:hypothetical protein